MKRVTVRVAIAACTFVIGVAAAAIWLSRPAPPLSRARPATVEPRLPTPSEPDAPTPSEPNAPLDSTVYPVKLCDLVRDSNRYDGKLVRVRAFYNQGIDTSSLDDSACDAWLRPSCAGSAEACEKIWDRVLKAFRNGHTFKVRVDVVGRYTADVEDPDPNQGGSHIHLLEILELKDAQPVKVRD